MLIRRVVPAGVVAAMVLGALTACASEQSKGPAPVSEAGLSVVAEADGQRYLVHTESGDIDFIAGVNLPDSLPGYQPGELGITNEQYADWFNELDNMGIRTLRIYTTEMPHFYQELNQHNRRNPDDPLYLSIGVYLPDAEGLAENQDLYDETITEDFQREIQDAVAAAHGDLEREHQFGRAYGTWTADVSQWVIGWMPGSEIDGPTVDNTDTVHADAPAHNGKYFASTPDATPSERWLAARIDELATAEASYGTSSPIGFVNWPTTDPLSHPYEPIQEEDLAGLDANHILPTEAWPGGTYAIYDAYPYYPDFLSHQPELQDFQYKGKADPFAGYLSNLLEFHAGMPVFLAEFGVPSSLGSAHVAPLGRGQGDHSELEASQINGDLIQMQHDLGLAGGFLFAWQDEWFKRTWNTEPRQVPADRRHLWHDPWTNEQYFGLWATDGKELGHATLASQGGPVGEMDASWDQSWVYLTLPAGAFDRPIRIGFDVLEGGPSSGLLPDGQTPDESSDYSLVLDPDGDEGAGSAQLYSRAELDGPLLEARFTPGQRPVEDGWVRTQLLISHELKVPPTGEVLPPEFQEVGQLRKGGWDPTDAGSDVRNTWRLDGDKIVVRIPWLGLGISDPSSKQALTISPDPEGVRPHIAGSTPVESIGVVVEVGDERVQVESVTWEPWESVAPNTWARRLKAGSEQVTDLMALLSQPS